jgi:haloalkane dehalogenase
MEFLRTPDARFAGLPDWPFMPRYVEIPSGDGGTLRVHYVDEGSGAAPAIVCLHGEPTWSYLYRKLIPRFVAAGYRVLAPDLVGFGRSDKPVDPSVYSYARHVEWLTAWFRAVSPPTVTLLAHDWGGWLGLRVVAADPGRFARIVVTNTGLPTCDEPPNETARAWFEFALGIEVFPAGQVIQLGTTTEPPPDVIAAYDAPFPDERYKAGPRQFPVFAPKTPDDPGVAENREAWRVLERLETPFLTVFGDGDPLNEGNDRLFQQRVPGARHQPHCIIAGGGHFIQEDRAEEMAHVVVRWLREQGV